MFATIVKRILMGILVVFLVLTVTFFLMRLTPGDPARTIAGNAEPETIEALREEMGLNDPIPVQYFNYMKNLLSGDMGFSHFGKNNVSTIVATSWRPTVLMIGLALPTAIIIGLIFGLIAAVFKETIIDRIITAFAVLCQSMPNYWVAVMLIRIVSVQLGWLPASGYKGFKHAILPAVVLCLPLAASYARNVRTKMIAAMGQEFSKAAKARGIPYGKILIGYSFRDILVSFLTLVGASLGGMVGNCLLIENLFAYPGLGMQCINGILRRDYTLVQALVMIMSALFIALNTIIDISYMYLDPRIRKAEGGL